ncbi:hypothetical protein M9H77_08727 [Catharanthus roseus]|uniref:Uncharacterized protein n=1 Tax=Catharanthus roseus TaxID=4058 RepID=A0ACC0BYS8_CATRO|nr:hypothetical protein M9H77_08727 [Catharanthus roseus]
MISFKSNWSIGKYRVESTGIVGDESQKDAQEVEEVEEEEEEVTTTSFLRHMKICVKKKISMEAAEQQTRLNSLPTDSALPLVPPINSQKVYMEQMRESPAH